GLVLQLREGLAFIDAELARLCEALATQADAHRRTVLPGRTWLQQASPVTLGAKLAACLAAFDRDRARLAALQLRLFVVQLGAAATRMPGLVATMLAAAVQEHERGLGNWPAEWETLPQIVQLAGGALVAMAEVVAGLSVDAARMRRNVDLTQGQLFAEALQMAL